MGALDGWASAAIAGGIGGTTTGIALWFTIRHDRSARQDDRLHDSTDAALLAAAELLNVILDGADAHALLNRLVLFTNAATIFHARLPTADPVRQLIGQLGDAISDRTLEYRLDQRIGTRRLLAAIRAYLDTVAKWLKPPTAPVPSIDELLAVFDALD